MKTLIALSFALSSIITGCGSIPAALEGAGNGSGTGIQTAPDSAVAPAAQAGQAATPTVSVNTTVTTSVVVNDPRPAASIDPVIAQLITSFKADALARGAIIPTGPELRVAAIVTQVPADANLNGDTLAWCQDVHGTDGLGNPLTWRELHVLAPAVSPLQQEAPGFSASASDFDFRRIVYHELGHCLLNVGHTAADSDQITSVMYPIYLPLTEVSEAWWSSELDQFFSASYLAGLMPRNG